MTPFNLIRLICLLFLLSSCREQLSQEECGKDCGEESNEPLAEKIVIPDVKVKYNSGALGIDIPDRDRGGIRHTITIPDDIKIKEAYISYTIAHTYIGDLVVSLYKDQQLVKVLHNRQGGSQDNLNQNHALSEMIGKSTKGTWTLEVKDLAYYDVGALNSWSLHFKGEPEPTPVCEGYPSEEIPVVTSSQRFLVEPETLTNHPLPGSCDLNEAPDQAFLIEVEKRSIISIYSSANNPIISLFETSCKDEVLECSAVPFQTVVDPGSYYVIVDYPEITEPNHRLAIRIVDEPEGGLVVCPESANYCSNEITTLCDPNKSEQVIQCNYNYTYQCIEHTLSNCEDLIGFGSQCDLNPPFTAAKALCSPQPNLANCEPYPNEEIPLINSSVILPLSTTSLSNHSLEGSCGLNSTPDQALLVNLSEPSILTVSATVYHPIISLFGDSCDGEALDCQGHYLQRQLEPGLYHLVVDYTDLGGPDEYLEIDISPKTASELTVCPTSTDFCTDLGYYCDPNQPNQVIECIYSPNLGCIEHGTANCDNLLGTGSTCDINSPILDVEQICSSSPTPTCGSHAPADIPIIDASASFTVDRTTLSHHELTGSCDTINGVDHAVLVEIEQRSMILVNGGHPASMVSLFTTGCDTEASACQGKDLQEVVDPGLYYVVVDFPPEGDGLPNVATIEIEIVQEPDNGFTICNGAETYCTELGTSCDSNNPKDVHVCQYEPDLGCITLYQTNCEIPMGIGSTCSLNPPLLIPYSGLETVCSAPYQGVCGSHAPADIPVIDASASFTVDRNTLSHHELTGSCDTINGVDHAVLVEIEQRSMIIVNGGHPESMVSLFTTGCDTEASACHGQYLQEVVDPGLYYVVVDFPPTGDGLSNIATIGIEIVQEPTNGFVICNGAETYCTGLSTSCDSNSPKDINTCEYDPSLGCIAFYQTNCETLVDVGSVCSLSPLML